MNTDDHAILFLKSVIAKACSGVGCDFCRGAGVIDGLLCARWLQQAWSDNSNSNPTLNTGEICRNDLQVFLLRLELLLGLIDRSRQRFN